MAKGRTTREIKEAINELLGFKEYSQLIFTTTAPYKEDLIKLEAAIVELKEKMST